MWEKMRVRMRRKEVVSLFLIYGENLHYVLNNMIFAGPLDTWIMGGVQSGAHNFGDALWVQERQKQKGLR